MHTKTVQEQLNSRSGAARVPGRLESTEVWQRLQHGFLKAGDTAALQQGLTAARDAMAIEAFQAGVEPAFPQSVAMVAGGSYGRGDTFPYSTMALVLVVESARQSEPVRQLLPAFVGHLWQLGLRVESTVLPVGACREAVAQGNGAALNLIGCRYLAGDRAVWEALQQQVGVALESHAQKISDRLCQAARDRHERFQNTPLHAEPDVKQAPGGVEDLRLIDCLTLLKPDLENPGDEFRGASALVKAVRCFLHFRRGPDGNVLDFEVQEGLRSGEFAAGRYGADVVREYFRSARQIFNQARRSIEAAERSRTALLDTFREYRARVSNQEFTVSRDRLLLRNPAQLAGNPGLVFSVLEFVARHDVPAAGDTERRLEASREAFAAYCAGQALWPTLKNSLACPHADMALRTLDATSLLPALFPEWAAIEYRVAAEAGYRYTVDEHVLRSIERVVELRFEAPAERQRFAQLLAETDDVPALLFALLFHEMGRGEADPLEAACQRARAAMARLGMPENVRHTVEFLIRHQADLSESVTGRNMDDPAAVRQMAERAGTAEHLRMLCLMVYGKTTAAGADANLSWRLERLWHAYGITHHELVRELETDRIQQLPEELSARAEFIKGFPQRYLHAHSAAEIRAHVQLFEHSIPTGAAVQLEPIEGAYRLTVIARDKPSLFASFAGAISSFGLEILKAEAFSNAKGIVLDTFVFADPKRMLQQNPNEADRLTDLMQRVALGRTDVHKLMRGRPLPEARKHTAPPQVQFDSEACPTATLVEIATDDRPGLLYQLASVFSSSACNIEVVLVDTKGKRAIDVFYVAEAGKKLSLEAESVLRERLLAVC